RRTLHGAAGRTVAAGSSRGGGRPAACPRVRVESIRRTVTREDPLLPSLRRQRLPKVTAALAGAPQREPADVTLPELQPPFPPSRLLEGPLIDTLKECPI